MNIGLFDSGLGGLIVTHSLIQAMPEYNYMYLGDTARVPYGNRSQDTIYEFTKAGVEALFERGCSLVILACNTASAEALRKLQREHLPKHYPDRRILGVLVPAAEEVVATTQNGKVGVIATQGTVSSGAYVRQIQRLNPAIEVFQQATPLLVPLVENNALKYVEPILDDYLRPLLEQRIDTLVLGCTHYPLFKTLIRDKVGDTVRVLSQDEYVPVKLTEYLENHPEADGQLSKDGTYQFLVTESAPSTAEVARNLFGESVDLRKITLSPI